MFPITILYIKVIIASRGRQTHKILQCNKIRTILEVWTNVWGTPWLLWISIIFKTYFGGIGPICSSEDLDFTLDSKVGDLTLA